MFYFAYGSNMSVAQMAHRAPGARPVGTGCLDGHRLFFTADGYAAIRPQRGHRVHGVVWQVTARDIAVLDRYEGVGEGWYRRCRVAVRHGGRTRACLVYVGADVVEGGRPIRRYFAEGVMAPALAWSLPSRYIASLARFARGGFRG